MNSYYYSFSRYLKNRFGGRVHRLSLDGGFGCPNIDGTFSNKGCVFCNNRAFSYFSRHDNISLEKQIASSMSYNRRRFEAQKFIAYFQGFTSTYGDKELLSRQYNVIRKFDDIVGIAVSTRPDCIDEEKLGIIESFTDKYEVYIEYGLQSAHDKTLKAINRNHTFADFKKAVDMTHKKRNIHISAHIILGLPGESKEDMLDTAKTISAMPLWGIKFHCLHVLRDTTLDRMYNKGGVRLLSEDEYIDILISFLEVIPPDYVILRLVSDADKDLLVAPEWMSRKQMVLRKIENEFKMRKTCQGRLYESTCYKS
ncbi:MAG: TIGR01212 family radical SAM protein [Candidatus Omnitrophica bacterium 4484_171]|nr:MAG: TIGR01212 family radical SAM protein [Candidatus Omnitrophica bacterium 4484_171]